VVLEVDHIVPRAEDGDDDPVNLATSCWDCNRGKGAIPLDRVMTGEDPHDRAIVELERLRQLQELNAVMAEQRLLREQWLGELCKHWPYEVRDSRDIAWLRELLHHVPAEAVRVAMDKAIAKGKTTGFAYVNAVLKSQREEGQVAWRG
jgi:hypothetical protein